MEKRKVYKISIIDKEISRTEFDRNTFYTSDSELTLVFKLIERDYKYDHGEILLYNENDNSFVTRQIEKKENDFVYELDSDIIPHYGTWKAQLQLVNDGDLYTSKPFEFNIVNDLSNLAPQPTLTDINNWSTLKKNAAELIDEMVTVIDDIKKAESQHEKAERIRQSQENSRVQSESERQSQERLRSQGESKRQSQENKRVQSENERLLKEIERNKNESNRQTIFENNEVRRKETFNANETTRQTNETARQQAESQRQSTFEVNETERQTTFETAELTREQSESSRVSAEEQRKIDHANRSAELASKADKVVLENLVSNGNFSLPNHPEWGSTDNIVHSIENNELAIIGNGPIIASGFNWFTFNKIKPLNDTSIYYITALAKGQGKAYIGINYNGSELNVNDNFRRITYLGRKTTFPMAVGSAVIGGSLGDEITFKEVMAINLTQTFGAGNEPTKEEMDELIKVTGYIDGEYALNNKEMLIWTLGLIRRNKNAIIALGGTI